MQGFGLRLRGLVTCVYIYIYIKSIFIHIHIYIYIYIYIQILLGGACSDACLRGCLAARSSL